MADIYIGNVKGPQGDTGATGPQGAPGNAATVNVGTVSTTAYGNPAQVVNSGTEHAAVLNFTIPQGAPGATVTQLDNLTLNTITTSTDQYPQIQVGDLGRVIFGKIIKFFQDLVTGLAAKVNYSDALTMEEIEASSDLTDKVSAAAASKSLKESLSNIATENDAITALNNQMSVFGQSCVKIGKFVFFHIAFKVDGSTAIASGTYILKFKYASSTRVDCSIKHFSGTVTSDLYIPLGNTQGMINGTALTAGGSGYVIDGMYYTNA